MNKDKLVKVVDDSGCFVCGADNPLGIKAELSVDKEKHSSYCAVVLADHFQGWQGVVHGGILATLLDEACAYACLTATAQCVTAEIKVRYRKPVPVDREIEIFGQLTDMSRKIWAAKSQIKIDGVIYAEAEAKMYNLAKK
jgi:uncharacterized protein (TIGR00369 family)